MIVTNCLANFVLAVTCPALDRNTTSIPLSRRRLPNEPKNYKNSKTCAQKIARRSPGRSQSGGVGSIHCIRDIASRCGFVSCPGRGEGALCGTASASWFQQPVYFAI